MTQLGFLGVVLVALTAAALAAGIITASAMGDPLQAWSFRLPILLSVPVYFTATWCVLRQGVRPSLSLILGVAVVIRVALVAGPPMLSSDIYRYVWDGRVQNAGINPYLHVPADPALAGLRDAAVYPHINRADYAPTIYPPAAQMLFAAVGFVSSGVVAMKIAMVAMEALAVGCLLRLLSLSGRPSSFVLVYAWNPLAAWEFSGNGHVDAAAGGLLALALLLRAGVRGRIFGAGVVLAGAMLVKFLPAVAAPALWRRGTAGWRFLAGGLACTTLLYGFYAWGAGWKVLGFLGAYGGEEGLDTGTGIWALAGLGLLTPLPGWVAQVYLAAAAVALGALGVWIGFRPRPLFGTAADVIRICADAGVLMAVVMVVLSPHYAWYFVWLAVPAVVAPSAALIWLSAAAVLLYQNPLPDHFLWQALFFGPALLLAWRDLRSARAPSPLPVLQGGLR